MRPEVQAILADLPEKPPRSRLDPHIELIEELRARSWTFQQIADVLAERCQVRVTGSGVHDFLRRRTRRSASLVAARTDIPPKPRSVVGIQPSAEITTEFLYEADEPLKLNVRSKDRG
jgi:hypothetical protein